MTKKTDQTLIERLVEVEITGRLWGIRPDLLSPLAALDGSVFGDDLAASIEAAARSNPRAPHQQGAIAVVPLQGMITPKMSLMAMIFGGGGSGLQRFRSNMAAAAADPDVSAIVMDVDSPGGYVDMVPETAAAIRAVRKVKPVISVSNTQMGSAAYWLGSQASEMVASPSSTTGSIGVYKIHQDHSQRLAIAGVEPTIIKAGKYKIEGNPYSSLSDEAAQAWQDQVDSYYSMFTGDVAKGRGVSSEDVKAGYGEGRMLLASDAKTAGMVDRVGTLEQTVQRLAHPGALSALRKHDQKALEGDDSVILLDAPNDGKDLEPPASGEAESRDDWYASLSQEEQDRYLTVMLA